MNLREKSPFIWGPVLYCKPEDSIWLSAIWLLKVKTEDCMDGTEINGSLMDWLIIDFPPYKGLLCARFPYINGGDAKEESIDFNWKRGS